MNSENIERFVKKKKLANQSYPKKKTSSKKYFAPPSKFNPNLYKIKDWMALGLSEKQSQSILNFVKRGIYSNSSLEKIYTMPIQVFELIKDSTYYAPFESPRLSIHDSDSLVVAPKLEINTATKEDLIDLSGVGPFYAKQILKYRDELGGFTFKEQLLEVWKMRLDTYNKITPQIKIDASVIKKININECSIDELKMHPYLDYYQSNSIIKMRIQLEKFTELIDIQKSKLINEEEFKRLKPYFSL